MQSFMLKTVALIFAAITYTSLASRCFADMPKELALTANGKALFPIVIAENGSQETRETAQTLSTYLEQICDVAFLIENGNGMMGIAVGTYHEFPDLKLNHLFDANNPFRRDDYLIRTHPNGIYIIGATSSAVEFAIWDLLHRFGYRFFFPTKHWEIIPRLEELNISVDTFEQPSYYNRNAPRGGIRMGRRPWVYPQLWSQWQTRNRLKPSFTLNTGHMYTTLIRRNQQAFNENPEFYAKVNGKRQHVGSTTKLCIGNEKLRQLVIEDSIRMIENNPEQDSISLDPSDGSNWCDHDCDLCAPLGSVSDRVVMLCNEVAEALVQHFDRTYYIGIYAYHDYSPAPSIDLHPNVIPSLATAFIRGRMSFADMLEGWGAKSELLGIREYYALPMWESFLPGKARAANLWYFHHTIPRHYEAGARFVNAESDESWGPNGPGYYLATRFLWNVDTKTETVFDDFLEKAFGTAQQPMREFYDMILTNPLHSDHMMGVMFRSLAEAREQTHDPDVLNRIDDLVLYTRFVELYRSFQAAQLGQKQQPFDDLVAFVWRSRKHMMVDSLGLFYYLNRHQRANQVAWIPGEGRSLAEPPERLRIKENDPFSEEEIQDYLEQGIKNHDILDFEQVNFSANLVPAATRLNFPEVNVEMPSAWRSRGRRTYFTWVDEAPHSFNFSMVNGLIPHYRDRGDASIKLRPINEPFGNPVATEDIPPDGEVRTFSMNTDYDGLHRIELSDGLDSSRLEWEPGTPMTLQLDFRNRFKRGPVTLYFYVPKNTDRIGGYGQNLNGQLIGPDGETVHVFNNEMGYFSIPVAENQDGQLWSFKGVLYKTHFMLMTVPPYMARDPRELLLPEEVVQADEIR